MDVDDLMPLVGEYGTYQRLVLWLVLMPGTFPCGFHAYNQLFMAFTPGHWCRVTELEQWKTNISERVLKDLSIPFQEVTQTFSNCYRYDYNYTSLISQHFAALGDQNANATDLLRSIGDLKTVPCDQGWVYDLSDGATSVVADWDLVCGKMFLPTLALILFGACGFVGNFVFGYIMDGFGRHPSYFLYILILCIFGLSTSWATSFTVWLVLRLGVALTVPAVMTTPFVLAIELVGPRHRTFTIVAMNVAYSFTLITLSIVVYFVRDWRMLSLATTVPFVFYFSFWWILPESPHWLVANGRITEAFRVLNKMAKINKNVLPDNFLNLLQEDSGCDPMSQPPAPRANVTGKGELEANVV